MKQQSSHLVTLNKIFVSYVGPYLKIGGNWVDADNNTFKKLKRYIIDR